MADQKDDWKSGTSYGGSGIGSTGSAAASNSGMGDGTGGNGMSGTASATESVKQSGVRLASEAKQYAGDMALRAKEKGRTVFEQQKDNAAEQVNSVAHAFRSTADHLQGDGQAQVARYVGLAADQIESFGSRLREKDLDTLIHDAQTLARRSPVAVFAGTVVAGFLLARFLKSSSERRAGYMGMSESQRGSSMEGERYPTMRNDSGSTGMGTASTSATGMRDSTTGSTSGTVPGATSVGTTPSPLSGSNSGGTTL
ncbi:MAG: hypothetical protein JWM42_1140 [Burkholderia sp.]|nr:hypothetical protein [Burkholderia sp.]